MFVINLVRACANDSATLDGHSHFIVRRSRYISITVAKIYFRKYKVRSARLADYVGCYFNCSRFDDCAKFVFSTDLTTDICDRFQFSGRVFYLK